MKTNKKLLYLFISLPSLLFGQNKFITKWYFTSSGTSINFNALTDGVIGDSVSYTWKASPSGNNGKGKFRNTSAGPVSLVNLIILSGDVVTLSIDSAKLKRFFIYNKGAGVDRLKLIDVVQWGSVKWSSMESAFYGCENLQISATDTPNLSTVTICSDMFRQCTNLNSPSNIGRWNTANVKEMDGMFAAALKFNQSVNGWNTRNVTDMSVMFGSARNFNQPLDSWNTSNVIFALDMFSGARSFNQPLNSWNTSNFKSMIGMFKGATAFNQPLNKWNTAKVTSMHSMFANAIAFNQSLNSWNTTMVVDMFNMFYGAKAFNQPLNKWNVKNVADFSYMFFNAKAFNKSLAAWGPQLKNYVYFINFLDSCGMDVTNYDSTLIGFWRYSPNRLVNMGAAGLKYCKAKLQRDSLILASGSGGNNWTITGDIQDLYCGAFVTLWSNFTNNTTQIEFNAQTSGGVVNYTWFASPSGNNGTGSFILTSAGPVTLAGLNIPAGNTLIIKMTPNNLRRFFVNNGVNRQNLFEIKEWGSVKWSSMINAFYGCTNLQITATDSPNLSTVSNCSNMFRQCTKLNSPSNIDKWNTANITNMNGMFESAIEFNQSINSWNTTKVTNVSNMFYDARSFNQPLNAWNTSNITNMSFMFCNAIAFNQSLNSWNTTMVVEMHNMFGNAKAFNQYLDKWNVKNVTNFSNMFYNAKAFNKNMAVWGGQLKTYVNLSNFLDSCGMDLANYDSTLIGFWRFSPRGLNMGAAGLRYCKAKLQRDSLILASGSGGNNWTISGDIQDLYCGAFVTLWSNFTNNTTQIEFNAQTSGGVVNYTWFASPSGNNGTGSFILTSAGPVTLAGLNIPAGNTLIIKMTPNNLRRFFVNNGVNRQNLFEIKEWGSVKWSSMINAFYGCTNLQITATDSPNLSTVSNCSNMFRQCTKLNSPSNIDKWNTANITNMNGMFESAIEFNQSINSWNTTKVTNVSNMFYDARSFNQPLNAWNTSNITNMSFMFCNAIAFNQSLNSWNTTMVVEMHNMFGNAKAFNQYLDKWNVKNVTNFSNMFYNAKAFNKNMAVWGGQLKTYVNLSNFLDSCGMDLANYDSTLIGFWRFSPSGLNLGAAGLKYCKSKLQRDSLILALGSGGKGWSSNIGDALINTYPVLSDKGKSVTLINECSFNYFNPLNNSQHLIHLNPNGNKNFIPTNITINHNSIDSLPDIITSKNGYYQVSRLDSTLRFSNQLVSIAASGKFNTNGGVIIRIYYDLTEFLSLKNDTTPAGAKITESGWFKSSFHSAKELLENIKTSKDLFLNAVKISPISTGTEDGISYADFLLTDFSIIGFYARNDNFSSVNDINLKKTKVLVYPNPNEGILTISNLLSEHINTIQIKDALGRTVFSSILNENANEIQITMPSEKGIYFIEIQSSDKLIIEKITRI